MRGAAPAVGVIAVMCVAGGVVAGDGARAAPGDEPLFALTAERSDHSQVLLMRTDGTQRRRLRSAVGPGEDHSSEPDWAPDGRTLAFATERPSGNPDQDRSEIHSIRVDGTGEQRLSGPSLSDGEPAFSPDGARIAFTRLIAARRTRFESAIAVMQADGTAQTRLTHGALDFTPSWSPDGTRIVFSRMRVMRRAFSEPRLFVINRDGTGMRDLGVPGYAPAWSPDGGRIAFVAPGPSCRTLDCRSQTDVYTVAPDGTHRAQLTRTVATEGPPAWSADGGRLAFTSDRSYRNNEEAYVMRSDGSCATRLTNSSAKSGTPRWRPTDVASAALPCGGSTAAALAPLVVTDLTAALAFRRFPLFYLGPTYRNMLLTDASFDSDSEPEFAFSYDDCGRPTRRGCDDDIRVAMTSVCVPHTLAYLSPDGAGGPVPRYFHVRGALGIFVPDGPVLPSTHLYTGKLEISFDARSLRQARRVAAALRPVAGANRRVLGAPRSPASVLRRVHAVQRVLARDPSVRRAARKLHVSTFEIRERRRLGRALRQFGRLRASDCGPVRVPARARAPRAP